MMIMTKQEAKEAARVWAANAESPIDRDTQIQIMKTAAWRHAQLRAQLINKYQEMFAKKGKDHDPLG